MCRIELARELSSPQHTRVSALIDGAKYHYCVSSDADAAERQVRRQCLHSLADQANIPDRIEFVRTWDTPVMVTAAEPEAPRGRGRRGR